MSTLRRRDSFPSNDLAGVSASASSWYSVLASGWRPFPHCFSCRNSSTTIALSKVLSPNRESGGAASVVMGSGFGLLIRERPEAAQKWAWLAGRCQDLSYAVRGFNQRTKTKVANSTGVDRQWRIGRAVAKEQDNRRQCSKQQYSPLLAQAVQAEDTEAPASQLRS